MTPQKYMLIFCLISFPALLPIITSAQQSKENSVDTEPSGNESGNASTGTSSPAASDTANDTDAENDVGKDTDTDTMPGDLLNIRIAPTPVKEAEPPSSDAAENLTADTSTASEANNAAGTSAPTVQTEEIDGQEAMMDLDLETLLDTPIEVWTATKTKSTLREAPAVVTVVTKEEIRNRGYQSLAEILKHTLGFYVVDDHILPNLGIRGVAGGFMGESGTVKVMIDGRSVAFRSTGGNWIGPELVPLSAIERIEIIRGPASALYGADAFLGVVNVITIRGADLNLGSIQGSGSYNTDSALGHDLDLAMGARRGNFEIMLSGRTNKEDRSGLKLPASSPLPNISSYRADNPRASHLISSSNVAHGKLTYYINDNNQISLMGHISTIERGGEFSPWSQLSYGVDEHGHLRGTTISMFQTMAGLDVASSLTEDFSLDFKITYLQGQPIDDDTIDTGNDLYSIQRDFGYKALETSIEAHWKIIEDLTSVLGTEFSYDWENLPSSLHVLREANDTQSAGEIQELSSTRQGDKDLYNLGAFAQLSWSGFKPYLDLTGGFRYDYHSIYGSQYSGRVGATSNPQKMLYLKLLYGAAFKAPSPLLLYAVPYEVGDIVGNPELKPQKVHTVEGMVILQPASFISLSTGLAYNILLDKAEFVQRGINRIADNLSQMKSLSWESEISAGYKEWVKGKVSFEWQRTIREFGRRESAYLSYLVGENNVIYPDFIVRANVLGRIPKVPFQVGLELMVAGERPSSEMNAIENLSMYSLPAYVGLDASLSTVGIGIVKDRETVISLIGRNLTNRTVADPGFAGVDYPLTPLTIFLQIRQEL